MEMKPIDSKTSLQTDKGKPSDPENPAQSSNKGFDASNRSVMAAPILASSSRSNRKSIMVLRCLFVFSLVLVVVICISVSLILIRDLEKEISIQTYESIAVNALNDAKVRQA